MAKFMKKSPDDQALGTKDKQEDEAEPSLSQASSTFNDLFSQESSVADPLSPLSASKYVVIPEAEVQEEMPEPEVRSSFVFSTPEHEARFHRASVMESHRAFLNLPPTTQDVLNDVDTLLASLPAPLPSGTCVILEPE